MTLERLKEIYIKLILSKSKTKVEAARILGMPARTLRHYLRRYKMSGMMKKVGDEDFCMRNLTPEERDFFENLDTDELLWRNNIDRL